MVYADCPEVNVFAGTISEGHFSAISMWRDASSGCRDFITSGYLTNMSTPPNTNLRCDTQFIFTIPPFMSTCFFLGNWYQFSVPSREDLLLWCSKLIYSRIRQIAENVAQMLDLWVMPIMFTVGLRCKVPIKQIWWVRSIINDQLCSRKLSTYRKPR